MCLPVDEAMEALMAAVHRMGAADNATATFWKSKSAKNILEMAVPEGTDL